MNAIVYVRVSSQDQVEGTSLESQEIACREYARRHNLDVSQVFVEQGESAKFADRTQLLALLDYCKVKSNATSALIVWKLDRFARNVEDHFAIKAALRRHGVSVVSVTEPIAQDANGKLMETILAGFAAFDNDVRALRSIQGMQQRLRNGLFPWKPPLGYLPPRLGRKTEPDYPDSRRFEPLKKAWQLFATGAYTKASIVRLLQSWGVLAYRRESVSPQMLDYILRNPYYAGILRDPWTGAEYEGRHVAMVSRQEFARVQELVAIRNNVQPHHRVNRDFPLRGLVRCPTCEHPLTGAFSRGRRKSYPYYNCFRRDCSTRTRSYAAKAVHDEFTAWLRELSVAAPLCQATLHDVRLVVTAERETTQKATRSIGDSIHVLERQFGELIAMRASKLITDAEFISQRDKLQRQRCTLEAKTDVPQDRWLTDTDERYLIASMQDIYGLWESTPIDFRRRFEELMLPVGYVFQKVRTAERGLLFSVFAPSRDGESNEAALVKPNLNQLMSDISKLLAIVRARHDDGEPEAEAA
jgi:site-specific DNA recombinase